MRISQAFFATYTTLLVILTTVQVSVAQTKDTVKLKVRRRVLDVATNLAEGNQLGPMHDDISGFPNIRSERLRFIKDSSSDDELLELLRYPVPAMRCYAFLALREKQSSKIINALPLLYNDTAMVRNQYIGYCGELKVTDFIYWLTMPRFIKHSEIKLTKQQWKELRLFRKLMRLYGSKHGISCKRRVPK